MTVRSERSQGLGRGLASLIPQRSAGQPGTLEVPTSRIKPNPHQPRKRFDPDSLATLTASIAEHGVLQPILVTETRPGVRAANKRFATRVPPRPCGAYTRNWLPAPRFRGPGRYTITLRARDKSALTSLPAKKTFFRR